MRRYAVITDTGCDGKFLHGHFDSLSYAHSTCIPSKYEIGGAVVEYQAAIQGGFPTQHTRIVDTYTGKNVDVKRRLNDFLRRCRARGINLNNCSRSSAILDEFMPVKIGAENYLVPETCKLNPQQFITVQKLLTRYGSIPAFRHW